MKLSDKHRPARLAEVCGQTPPIKFFAKLAADPYPCCVLLEGGPGVGKTSTAIAFANELGCEGPFSGLHIYPCSEFDIQTCRMLFEGDANRSPLLRLRPLEGKGYHVLILEEFDWLHTQVQRYLKVALEHLPPRVIVVATSNGAGGLNAALLQRFTLFAYNGGQSLQNACQDRLAAIWASETGQDSMPPGWPSWGFTGDGWSFRRALDDMQRHLMMVAA